MSTQPDRWSGEGWSREAAANLTLASDDELEASIPRLKRQIDAAQAELALRVAEYDRRKLADERYRLSTKQWLRHTCRMTPTQAATVLRHGVQLESVPGLRDASLAGEITIESNRAIAGLHHRYPSAFADHGAVLVDAATYLAPDELRRAIEYWSQQIAPLQAGGDISGRRAQRRLSVNQTFDGMWAVDGLLDPESGHVMETTVRAIADPQNLDAEDRRTPAQRRADALTEACRFWLDHNDTAVTSSGVKPHITVTVAYEHLVRPVDDPARDPSEDLVQDPSNGRSAGSIDIERGVRPQIDGVAVDDETIRRLACDADIVRIVTKGDSEVLDVGRSTRTVPPAVRRALDHRDGGCTWHGCDAPAGWCDAHHIVHWADGGATSLDNLRLLCRRHHRAIHDRPSRRRRPDGPTSPDE